jgi:hypothetical protein
MAEATRSNASNNGSKVPGSGSDQDDSLHNIQHDALHAFRREQVLQP